MAPMPSIKTVKPDTNYLYAEAEAEEESSDSSPIPSSPPSSTGQAKSQCSSLSDGESFEGYGENVNGSLRHTANGNANVSNNLNETGGVELQLSRFTPQSNSSTNNDDDLDMIPRDSWARRSLRRAPTSNPDSLQHRRWGSMRHSGRRQLGSNALASQLYRSSSFNSSGRSSNCDTTEDMYSLENVQDLNYKEYVIQKQIGCSLAFCVTARVHGSSLNRFNSYQNY